ncbi:MAG TPA: ChaN family lipoprotein [Alphaproteobacteria bacterium]
MQDLAARVRRAFSLAIKKPRTSIIEMHDRVVNLATSRKDAGIALAEVHGEYAHARFIRAALPQLAEAGTRKMYIEHFQQWMQPVLDEWQETGDASDVKRLFNEALGLAHSRDQWVHTWKILNVARENNIRVIALEPDTVYAPYIGLSILGRNYEWQKRIEQDQAQSPSPYILYCGQGHVTRKNDHGAFPVTKMLGIPAVMLRRGLPSYHESAVDQDLFHCWLPMSFDQTQITGVRMQAPKLVH